MMSEYLCPTHKTNLARKAEGYHCEHCGDFTREEIGGIEVVNLLGGDSKTAEEKNLMQYKGKQQNEIYRNFLQWLFATFHTTEEAFRAKLFSGLSLENARNILITGCGNGDDLVAIQPLLLRTGPVGVWAQDISPEMVYYSAGRVTNTQNLTFHFSLSDACNLPFADNFFDVAFHFGGINLMPSVASAISEMTRVVKNGGHVAFGDEGIAPWLKQTEYYRMMVENIGNWSLPAPIDLLPSSATEVYVTWLLENCFYFIRYIKNDRFPHVNIDVKHLGKRGGSIRTRYFGKLEGVSPEAKEIAIKNAAAAGASLHDWLDSLIKKQK
jgi:ubiquinone/menaquinone biosynthesis C-methylase UbiE